MQSSVKKQEKEKTERVKTCIAYISTKLGDRGTFDSRLKGWRFDSWPVCCQVTTLGKLFTHMCLCHQAVYIGTSQRATMPYSWEGNRRSVVALAMRHRLQWFIHLRVQQLSKGDGHPAYTALRSMAPLCLRGAHWRHLANTIDPSVYGSSAGLCHIALFMLVLTVVALSVSDLNPDKHHNTEDEVFRVPHPPRDNHIGRSPMSQSTR